MRPYQNGAGNGAVFVLPMRPVAKLHHETDPPDSNSHHADSDAKIGCRPDRTGDNPDDASKDDRERNEIGEDFVAHHSIRLARTWSQPPDGPGRDGYGENDPDDHVKLPISAVAPLCSEHDLSSAAVSTILGPIRGAWEKGRAARDGKRPSLGRKRSVE